MPLVRRSSSLRWDVVAVSSTVEHEADGLRFVRSFKCLSPAILSEHLAALSRRYAAVPFVVLPLPGTTEFAVFRSSTDWSLGDAASCPIAALLLRVRPVQ